MSEMQTKLHVKDDVMVVENIQDCTPYLERAKALHNEGIHGSTDFKHAAELPKVAIESYINRHGITFAQWMADPVHIKRMLNDPDLKGFRVWPGRV
ncbi:hypothetical protein J7E70_07800 [Variovorax paradoxus]|nr:hypothetical protein [Variovorax paradoxus]MBT2300366.1 hypothetical protein [Variovorax paradoxus]